MQSVSETCKFAKTTPYFEVTGPEILLLVQLLNLTSDAEAMDEYQTEEEVGLKLDNCFFFMYPLSSKNILLKFVY